jgi:hypothetical protein
VTFIRTDVSEERFTSIVRVTIIGELGTTLAVTSNRSTLVFLRNVLRLLVTANVVPRSPILVTLMMEDIRSSKTSVLTRARRRLIAEDDIPAFFRRANRHAVGTIMLATVCPEVQSIEFRVSSPEAGSNIRLPEEASKLQTNKDFK